MAANNKSDKKDISNSFQKAGPYLNIGYALFGGIIFFGYVGNLLDNHFQKNPLFLVIGVFLGFSLGLYRMIKVVNELEKK